MNKEKGLPAGKAGFTLIELLIGLAMTAVVFLLTTQVVIALLGRTTKGSRVETLEQTKNDIQTDLNNSIKWAEKVDFVDGVLSVDDTNFELVDGAILKNGERLTSNDVRITSFEVFKRTESESASSGQDGIGLNAEYYNTRDFTGDPIQQIDFEVDFFWGTDPPIPGLNENNVSVRWSGQVETIDDGQYTFYTRSDDGSRLWVNGQLVVDNWGYHGMTTKEGKITLEGHKRYDIVLEYFESGNYAGCRLMWSHKDIHEEVIPTQYLYPTAARANLEVVINAEHVEDPSLTDTYRIILTPRSGTVGAVHPAPTSSPQSTGSPSASGGTESPRPTITSSPSPTPTGPGDRPTLPPATSSPSPTPTPTPKPLR